MAGRFSSDRQPPDRESGGLAVSTRGLRKVFGDKAAVKNLTLDVPRGEVLGLLGPNGAGKSTTVKMLLGLVAPTSGTATVLGRPAGDIAVRARIGFLPEHFRFYDWLTATELLRLHGRLYGMPAALLRGRIPALLDLVGLTPHFRKQLRHFSKGMLQRIGLAQALLNDPDLIILDEPTSGLDPGGRRLVREIIKAQRERGATVLLNSHLLSEVEVTCDRVAFIREGEVVETRELGDAGQDECRVLVRASGICSDAVEGLSRWASAVEFEQDMLILTVESRDRLPEILRYLVESGAKVFEFTPQVTSLEERFLEIVGADGGM